MSRLLLPFMRHKRKSGTDSPDSIEGKVQELRGLLHEIQSVKASLGSDENFRIKALVQSIPMIEAIAAQVSVDQWESVFAGFSEYTRWLCHVFNAEVTGRMVEVRTRGMGQIDEFFASDSNDGGKLLKLLRILCQGPVKLIDIMGICSVPCSIAKIMHAYATQDTCSIGTNADVLKQLFWNLMRRKACVEQIVLTDDLKFVFWTARMWSCADHARWLHEMSSGAMAIIGKSALTPVVIDYIRGQGCVKQFIQTIHSTCHLITEIRNNSENPSTSLCETHVNYLIGTFANFAKECSNTSLLIIDDFALYHGYKAIERFVRQFDHRTHQPNQTLILAETFKNIETICKCGRDYHTPNVKQADCVQFSDSGDEGSEVFPVALTSDWNYSVFEISDGTNTADTTIRNSNGLAILGQLFRSCETGPVLLHVINSLQSMIDSSPVNYFMMQSPSGITSDVIEILPCKPHAVQLAAIDFFMFVSKKLQIIPSNELIAMGKILKSNKYQSIALIQACITFLIDLLKLEPKANAMKTMLRKLGLIKIVAGHQLQPFVDRFKQMKCSKERPRKSLDDNFILELDQSSKLTKPARTRSESREISGIPSEQLSLIISVLDLLCLCTHRHAKNANHFRDLDGIRLIEQLIGSTHRIRLSALKLLENVVLFSIQEDDIARMLATISSERDPRTRLAIMSSLNRILESSSTARVIFRKVGGFIFLVSTLISMDNVLSTEHLAKLDVVAMFEVISMTFRILKTVLINDPINNRYFDEEVGWETLSTTLTRLGALNELCADRRALDKIVLRSLKRDRNNECLINLRQKFNTFFAGENISYDCLIDENAILTYSLIFIQTVDLTFGDLSSNVIVSRTCFLTCLKMLKSMGQLHGGCCPPNSRALTHLIGFLKNRLIDAAIKNDLENEDIYLSALIDIFHDELSDENHFWHSAISSIFISLSRISIRDMDIRRFLRLGLPIDLREHLLRNAGDLANLYRIGVKSRLISAITSPDDEPVKTLESLIPFVQLRDCEWPNTTTTNHDDDTSDQLSTEPKKSVSRYSYILIPNLCPPHSPKSFGNNYCGPLTVIGPEVSSTYRQPIQRSFPPSNGFTFSTWVQLGTSKTQGVVNLLTIAAKNPNDHDSETPVYKISLNLSKAAMIVTTYCQQKTSVTSSSQALFSIIDWFGHIQSRTWNLYTFTFSKSAYVRSSVHCYINGVSIGSKKLVYAHAVNVSPPAGLLGVGGGGSTNLEISNLRPVAYAIIGNAKVGPTKNDDSLLITLPALDMRQGSMCLLEECLTLESVQAIHRLGPDCDGIFEFCQSGCSVAEEKVVFFIQPRNSLRNVNFGELVVEEPLIAQIIEHSKFTHSSTDDLEFDVLYNLATKLKGNPRTMGAVLFVPNIASCRNQPKPPPLRLIRRNTLRMFLERISNGSALIVSFIEMCLSVGSSDPSAFFSALASLANIGSQSEQLRRQMSQDNIYGILRYILRRNRSLVNLLAVRLLFCLVSQQSSMQSSDTSRVEQVVNDEAFEHLICDVSIWKLASNSVQEHIIEFIQRVASNAKHVRDVLNQSGFVLRLLVQMNKQNEIEDKLLSAKCSLIIDLCVDCTESIFTICRYMFWSRRSKIIQRLLTCMVSDLQSKQNDRAVIVELIHVVSPLFFTSMIQPNTNPEIVIECLRLLSTCFKNPEILAEFRSNQLSHQWAHSLTAGNGGYEEVKQNRFFDQLADKISIHAHDPINRTPIIRVLFELMNCRSNHSFQERSLDRKNSILDDPTSFCQYRPNDDIDPNSVRSSSRQNCVPEVVSVLVAFAESIMLHSSSDDSVDAAAQAIVLINDLSVLIVDEQFLISGDPDNFQLTIRSLIDGLVDFLGTIHILKAEHRITSELFDVSHRTLLKLIREVIVQCLFSEQTPGIAGNARIGIVRHTVHQLLQLPKVPTQVTVEIMISLLSYYSHWIRDVDVSANVKSNSGGGNSSMTGIVQFAYHGRAMIASLECLLDCIWANHGKSDFCRLIRLIGGAIKDFGEKSHGDHTCSSVSCDALKQFNRLILCSLSPPPITIGDRISMLDKVHELTNYRHIVLCTLNSDPNFWCCLFYLMTKCTSELSMKKPKIDLNSAADEAQDLLDSAMQRLWADMDQQQKTQIIYSTLVTSSAEQQIIPLSVMKDFYVAKHKLATRAEKVWTSDLNEAAVRNIALRSDSANRNYQRHSKSDFMVADADTVSHVALAFQKQVERMTEDEFVELRFLAEQWSRLKGELFRERGLLGPCPPSELDQWMLDPTEGFARMRRRTMRNPDFYSSYLPHGSYESLKKITKVSRAPRSAQVDRLAHVLNGESISDVIKLPIKSSSDEKAIERIESYEPDNLNSPTAESSVSILTESTARHNNNENDVDSDDDDVENGGGGGNDATNFKDSNNNNSVKTAVSGRLSIDDSLILVDDANLTIDQSIRKLLGRNEKIREYCPCARITPASAIEGVILFGQTAFYLVDGFTVTNTDEIVRVPTECSPERMNRFSFVLPRLVTSMSSEESSKSSFCERFDYGMIRAILKRRYLLQQIALELFSSSGQTVLLAFKKSHRNRIYRRFVSVAVNMDSSSSNQESIFAFKPNASTGLEQGTFLTTLLGEKSVPQRWERGEISNFDYLMYLNTIAGRSYNDLMQYPVFPWILADYESEKLDLRRPSTFRDFSKPMGAQTADRFSKFQERFDEWGNYDSHGVQTPYHYNTHYSSAMIVSSYLIRLEPFSEVVANLQGGIFDLADRTFHSVQESWNSASRNNMSDVKELIPEFFYLPEFLTNSNQFDFGRKQSGELVDDVVLPRWAKNDAREFIRLHRAALESDYVSLHLHSWIDLIFGYRQKGKCAVEVGNVFHPLFYEGTVDFETIDDPTTRDATIGFINNFGQVPKQIFRRPHNPKKLSRRMLDSIPDDHSMIYIKNDDLFFKMIERLKVSLVRELRSAVGRRVPCGQIFSFPNGRVTAFPQKRAVLLMTGSVQVGSGGSLAGSGAGGISGGSSVVGVQRRYIDWDFKDGSVRICMTDSDRIVQNSEQALISGGISCVRTSPDRVVVGANDSLVYVFRLGADSKFELQAKLVGHDGRGKITALDVCHDYHVIASGSSDSLVIVWDLNNGDFVRQLNHRTSSDVTLNAVSVNRTTADICSCTDYELFVWTINGCLLAKVDSRLMDLCGKNCARFSCVDVSTIYAWDSDNVIVTGASNGIVRLWRLKFIQTSASDVDSSSLDEIPTDSGGDDVDDDDDEFVVVSEEDLKRANAQVETNRHKRHFHRLWRTQKPAESDVVNRLSIDLSSEKNSHRPLKPGYKWTRALVLAGTFDLGESFSEKATITAVHIPKHHRLFYAGTENGRIFQFCA